MASVLKPEVKSRRFNPLSLDALNFFLADVRTGFGPYLNVFLVTQRDWSQAQVGIITMIGGLLSIFVQTPVGGLIDKTRAKRALIVVSLACMALGSLAVFIWQKFWPVMIANAFVTTVGDVFLPAVAALTLGLFARRQLARRLGRNSAFDHGGNVVFALVASVICFYTSQRAVFLLVPVFAVLAAVSVLTIPAKAIDFDRARDAEPTHDQKPAISAYRVLLQSRPLVIFGVCALLFHLANAALLPLVSQKLAIQHPKEATAMVSTCIIAAQGVMLPIALLVGAKADTWGRKPLFLAGFAVLPVRAVLYTLSNNSFWLIGVQLLDGVGAGIYGALTPLVIADIMRGTGRYNLAQGAIATMQGIGAALSGLVAGVVVDRLGYAAGFLVLGAIAAVAFTVFLVAMPETAEANGG